jgi:hypothetical protein
MKTRQSLSLSRLHTTRAPAGITCHSSPGHGIDYLSGNGWRQEEMQAAQQREEEATISELVALTEIQRIRVRALWEKELVNNKRCPLLNAAVVVLRDKILSVRKMRGRERRRT